MSSYTVYPVEIRNPAKYNMNIAARVFIVWYAYQEELTMARRDW